MTFVQLMHSPGAEQPLERSATLTSCMRQADAATCLQRDCAGKPIVRFRNVSQLRFVPRRKGWLAGAAGRPGLHGRRGGRRGVRARAAAVAAVGRAWRFGWRHRAEAAAAPDRTPAGDDAVSATLVRGAIQVPIWADSGSRSCRHGLQVALRGRRCHEARLSGRASLLGLCCWQCCLECKAVAMSTCMQGLEPARRPAAGLRRGGGGVRGLGAGAGAARRAEPRSFHAAGYGGDAGAAEQRGRHRPAVRPFHRGDAGHPAARRRAA